MGVIKCYYLKGDLLKVWVLIIECVLKVIFKNLNEVLVSINVVLYIYCLIGVCILWGGCG